MVSCGICYRTTAHTTECGHHFCQGCLMHCGYCHICRRGSMCVKCPMCRRAIGEVSYPNTRSQIRQREVAARFSYLCSKIPVGNRIHAIEEVTRYVWKERAILRRCYLFSALVKKRVIVLIEQYRTMGKKMPVELKYLLNF